MLVTANQTVLEYDTFGNPDHEALLLISGLNTPMTRWSERFCHMLTQDGYFVIRYNNRDTGRSEHFAKYKTTGLIKVLAARILGIKLKLPYTIDDMVEDGMALLNKLHIHKAHVIGKSMGGIIAQLMASKHPERVLSLTVMMSTTGNIRLPGPTKSLLWLILKKKPNPKTDLQSYMQYRLKYTKQSVAKNTQLPNKLFAIGF